MYKCYIVFAENETAIFVFHRLFPSLIKYNVKLWSEFVQTRNAKISNKVQFFFTKHKEKYIMNFLLLSLDWFDVSSPRAFAW